MASMFVNTAGDWGKLSADVLVIAPVLKSALASCDIQSELDVIQNYAYLLEKLSAKAQELLKIREEAARPPGKLLGNDSPITNLRKDVDKMGQTAIEAGAKVSPSAKSMAAKLVKLGQAITKAREEEQGLTSAANKAVVALVKFGEAQLKSATVLARQNPVETIAGIKRAPGIPAVRGAV